jgi:hypothetical protein
MQKVKLNNFILGIISGLLLPFLSIFLYWAFSFKFVNFIPQFFKLLILGRLLSSIISLCLIPSLGMFFIFLNKEYYKTTRGIILSTVFYGFVIVVVKTWVEHSWSY